MQQVTELNENVLMWNVDYMSSLDQLVYEGYRKAAVAFSQFD